jgi:hypothetical protein
MSSVAAMRRRENERRCLVVKDRSDCRAASTGSLRTVESIVDAYIENYRPRAQDEVRFYRRRPTLQDAIEVAALARTAAETKHSHQRRIPLTVLKQARDKLVASANALRKCKDFATLFDQIRALILPIHGIGELAVYDIAQRIGAHLGKLPREVYLHRGTREGARALRLETGQRLSLAAHELPNGFQRLRPYELEDCLCIYEREIAKL